MYEGSYGEDRDDELSENIDQINQSLDDASCLFSELDDELQKAVGLGSENKAVIRSVIHRFESQNKRLSKRLDKIEKKLDL